MRFVSYFVLFLVPLALWAHGEDKFGPHGGYIRMPGAFHTEVKKNDSSLQIYLLDFEWKNPTVENSKVKASYVREAKVIELECEKESNFFECGLPKTFESSTGEIHIQAERDGMKGGIAKYELPLSLKK